jgi:hypothetical protein
MAVRYRLEAPDKFIEPMLMRSVSELTTAEEYYQKVLRPALKA